MRRLLCSLVIINIAASLIILAGCGAKVEAQRGWRCRALFDGRVTIEIQKRKGGLGPNMEPEYIIYHFNDVGEYKVSFQVPHDCHSGYWKCPEDFVVVVDSGTREIIKEFDALLGLPPSFTMTITRNGESQSCKYSNLNRN